MNLGRSINVGCALRDKRKVDVADYIGTTPNTVSNWCGGKTLPCVKALFELSEFFGVKLSTFIEWGEEE